MKESPIDSNQFFIPHSKSAEVSYPCNCALYFPAFSIPSKLSSILDFGFCSIFSMRSNKIYASLFELFTKGITVIGLVADETFRTLFGPTGSVSSYLDLFKGFSGKLHFRGRSRGKEASQRNTLAVDHHHPLCAFAPFGFTNASAPFFADTKLPSINASCQSMRPFSSSIDKNFRQTSSQTPWSSQSRNLRQHVDGLGYRSGRSCQRAPVRNTHIMPSRTCRLSIGGRPPFRLGLALEAVVSIVSIGHYL